MKDTLHESPGGRAQCVVSMFDEEPKGPAEIKKSQLLLFVEKLKLKFCTLLVDF